MTNNATLGVSEWPSIDDRHPDEEGGPIARSGLAYQDEIVVGIFLDMVEDGSIQKVHCETHDDIVVRRLAADSETVEYKSELASLRARQIAGQLAPDGATFHSTCIQKMDGINRPSDWRRDLACRKKVE